MPAFAIVEDHQLVIDAVQARLLTIYPDARFVYAGGDVIAAVDVIGADRPDCVLLDLDLGDGRSALDNVASVVETDVPVIIVSAMIDRGTVRSALGLGVTGFVSKQAPFGELAQAVESALHGFQYMSPDIAQALVAEPVVSLSEQERVALTLYASGLKMASVARRMGVSESTVNEYIKRVRVKYARAGTPVPTKVHLYRVAKDEGWLS